MVATHPRPVRTVAADRIEFEHAADGMEVHVFFGSGDDLRVSEIWDSREQLDAFGETLMPILADVGIGFSGDPEVFETQEIFKR